MANRDLWNYYMENRATKNNPPNTNVDQSSPPYDNFFVTDAQQTISVQQTHATIDGTDVIPGPGQVAQRGLARKRSHDARVLRGQSSQPRPTQSYIQEAFNEEPQNDTDFTCPQWTSTIDYIIQEGLLNLSTTHVGSFNNRTTPFWTQVGDIITGRSQFTKIKKVVAMLSIFTPNYLGDFLVTMKDPSGKIEGTMHHNIFQNNEYRLATGVGSVLILKNVTVSRFGMNTKYLNITERNIVKIIGPNSMVAAYQPTVAETSDEENEVPTGADYETVPDSEEE